MDQNTASLPVKRMRFMGRSLSGCSVVLLVLGVLVFLVPSSMVAQRPITITGTGNLRFGTVARSGSSSVGYESDNAASFIVTGDILKNVRLTVSISKLGAESGASSNAADRTFSPVVVNATCAYSLDGGLSWYKFSTGTLYHDTQFPLVLIATRSSILVRVGANITGRAHQQQGGYTGSVTLVAQYR